ncbi:glycosyltransferase family 39 protein, partial [bacterium]|nr:glycosyltransferase family 39 protein [bacterium]
VDIALVESDRALALVSIERGAREGVLRFYGDQRAVVDGDPSFRSPLFPALLAASERTFGKGRVEVVARSLLASDAGARAQASSEPRKDWRARQLPLVLPSLVASLVAVALAFLAGRTASGILGATLASLAVATAPLEVWCAHRVTADTLTEALAGAAALVLAGSVGVSGRRGVARAALAGFLGGLTVLSKSSGVLLVPAFVLAEGALLFHERRAARALDVRGALARAGAFALVLALSGLWWPILIAARSGNIAQALGYGGVGLPREALAGAWPTFTSSRPFWVPFASTAWLSPLLGLGAVALLLRAWSSLATNDVRSEETASREQRIVALASVALVFLVVTAAWPSRENRFLLPAYLPFAAGAAIVAQVLVSRAREPRSTTAALPFVLLVLLGALVMSADRSRELGPSGKYELCPVGPDYDHR